VKTILYRYTLAALVIAATLVMLWILRHAIAAGLGL